MDPNHAGDGDPPPSPPFASDNGGLALLEAIEKSRTTIETLDLNGLKVLVLAFERRLHENIEARLKYPDQPEKFMDSEIELHVELHTLKILADGPKLYPELVNLNTVPSILGLLNHDNTYIAIDVVSLLLELTDEDVLEDNDEPARVLVDCLVQNNALELLVQNLLRLNENETDEEAAIHYTLATIENLMDVDHSVAEIVCEKTGLFRWLLGKIKARPFDAYAAEILAILLQNNTANQRRLGEMNGVDEVLQAVAMCKSEDLKWSKDTEEVEMVENLFDCLCYLVLPRENVRSFLEAKCVELMIIIMNQLKFTYGSALRVMATAVSESALISCRFIESSGLSIAFVGIMRKVRVSKKCKKEGFQEEIERRTISLVSSLLVYTIDISNHTRVLDKFVEHEYEKLDMLMELYVRYSDRVKAEIERLDQLDLDGFEMDDEEKYNRKLQSGLTTLQLIAVILVYLWTSSTSKQNAGMRSRIMLVLNHLHKVTFNDIVDILKEYMDNIGEEDLFFEYAEMRIRSFIAWCTKLGP